MSPSPEARAALDADRARTLSRLARLEREQADIIAAAQSANSDDEHDPEGATIAFEREHAAALARLDAGTYGICERCGGPISPARLAARPAAATCIACAGLR